ncbi:MAG: hypothetical protein R3A52_19215 [Polyangiales bacterium]
MRARSTLPWAMAMLLLGCGGEGSTPTVTDAGSTVTDAPAVDVATVDAPAVDVPTKDVAEDVAADVMVVADASGVGPYPEGPYGNAVGNVLQGLEWEGFDNPTGEGVSNTRPYGPLSMQDVRARGRRYAIVHVSEFL